MAEVKNIIELIFHRLFLLIQRLFYSFPVQLLVNHVKRNQILLLCWAVLFAIISGNFGNYLGIPFLFLDPVYMNQVGFQSFFTLGLTLAGFSIAFHITSYIMDGHRFNFIGTLSRPFTTFSINNSIIPLVFVIYYILLIIRYKASNETNEQNETFLDVIGFLSGYILMTLLLFTYFRFTNKNIFKYVVDKVDEKLKQNIKVTRASAMKKLNIARKKQVRIDFYLNMRCVPIKVDTEKGEYDRENILRVFDQNHFNLVIIELSAVAALFLLGIFKDLEIFQLPAAASVILFLTIFVMFSGAFSYWFGNWSLTAIIILILAANTLMKNNVLNKLYPAFGLDYTTQPAPYNLERVNALGNHDQRKEDKTKTLELLNNWRAKFPGEQKPKMVFICVSGGGQRAALWTLNVLQTASKMTKDRLMKNSILITGASGGLIGASYFRELIYQQKLGEDIDPHAPEYLKNIASDNLNAIIFSLLMNDIFVGFQKFDYNNFQYDKDRGYTFENQLNKNTEFILDKPLISYREAEQKSIIPMLIMAPTIINDGRKLYISPQHVSYLTNVTDTVYDENKLNGIDFLRFFQDQKSEQLRFLSGLRMSATFPYITPNTTLPSDPKMEIMDAGITDNFGISDAMRFLFAFKEWISENTSGVILFSIRDSEKNSPIQPKENLSLFERATLPISSIYQNFESLQDITNDNKIAYASNWFEGKIDRVDVQYIPEDYAKENLSRSDSLRMNNVQRASLSWRLTGREKKSLISNIDTHSNQRALLKLRELLEENE
ncbi:patatin-like phospholipase family protein [Fulvivirga sp. M361]|uniref:patatin-like phospholipase family protein n=1 Tax=Fulvivirga sp. M361 TaxID=2594266 RepID=UPI00210329CE|nr:patatin-like phospholipase family protein [Fulvivirga sp. M361]